MPDAVRLPFGCNKALPAGVRCAWGARMIWPDDLLWDRQGCSDYGTVEERSNLLNWLNRVGGEAMRRRARELATVGAGEEDLTQSEDRTVVLYEDEHGKVVGNPQGSHGYLYVAAWLHEHVDG